MSKVRNLPELTEVDVNDELYIIDSSAGANAGRKVKVSTIKSAVIANAAEIPYNHTNSTLDSTDVQDAIDDLDTKLNDHSSRHAPDSIDGLPIGSPVEVTADGTNSPGIANSYTRSDHKHNVLTEAPSTQIPDQANDQGVSTALARADHVHQIPTAAPVSVGATNAQGSADTFAKSDHVHQGVHSIKVNAETPRYDDVSLVSGDGVSIVDDGSGNFTVDTLGGPNEFVLTNPSGLIMAYTGGNLRFDEVHLSVTSGNLVLLPNVNNGRIFVDSSGIVQQTASNVDAPPYCYVLASFSTNATMITALGDRRVFMNQKMVRGLASDLSTVTPDATAVQGSTYRFADAAHVHHISTAAPSTALSPSVSNAIGSSSSFARADHTHSIATALAADITEVKPGDAAAGGTANTFARGDHRHAISASTASSLTPNLANAEGTSTNFARADHIHSIATGTPVATGTANSEGVAALFARSDHVHDTTIATQDATATTDDNTGSLTDILMVGMTKTPVSGTYLVMFSGSVVNSANGSERTFVSFYSGGSQVTGTERGIGTSGGAYAPIHDHVVVTVNGSQAIDVRWRVVGGTSTVRQRKMTLIRLGA